VPRISVWSQISETNRPRCSIVSEAPLDRISTHWLLTSDLAKEVARAALQSGSPAQLSTTALSTTKNGGTHADGMQLNPKAFQPTRSTEISAAGILPIPFSDTRVTECAGRNLRTAHLCGIERCAKMRGWLDPSRLGKFPRPYSIAEGLMLGSPHQHTAQCRREDAQN
jgi:hypothetical protein